MDKGLKMPRPLRFQPPSSSRFWEAGGHTSSGWVGWLL